MEYYIVHGNVESNGCDVTLHQKSDVRWTFPTQKIAENEQMKQMPLIKQKKRRQILCFKHDETVVVMCSMHAGSGIGR